MSTADATTAGLSFLGGLLLGGTLIAPVLPSAMAALPSPESLGPVGKALVAGTLAITLLVFGMFGLYLVFQYLEG